MWLALLLAATTASAQPDCARLQASARPAIDEANGDWVRAMRAGDAPALAAAYADDGLFVHADGTVTRGRAAVEALYAAQATPASSITGGWIRTEGLGCAEGGLVIEWGQAALTLKAADGKPVSRGGPYLTVWKQISGHWRIIRNLTF